MTERRITRPIDPDGVSREPMVVRLRAQSAHLSGEPVIIMIQPTTVSYIDDDGTLLAADTIAFTVQQYGARQLKLPADFSASPAAGWTARLRYTDDDLLIGYPDGTVFYDGTMPTAPRWRTDMAGRPSVVLITGPAADLSQLEPVVTSGRASWVRIPFTVI